MAFDQGCQAGRARLKGKSKGNEESIGGGGGGGGGREMRGGEREIYTTFVSTSAWRVCVCVCVCGGGGSVSQRLGK